MTATDGLIMTPHDLLIRPHYFKAILPSLSVPSNTAGMSGEVLKIPLFALGRNTGRKGILVYFTAQCLIVYASGV